MGTTGSLTMIKVLTFQKVSKPNGRNLWPDTIIKVNRKKCGYIRHFDSKWRVCLAWRRVPTIQDPAPFSWSVSQVSHYTEPEARTWIRENWSKLSTGPKELYSFD